MSALRVARLLSGLEAKLFQIGGQTNPFGGQTSLFPNFRQFLERFIYLPKSDIIGLLDISEKNTVWKHMRICDAVALVAMGGRCRCREANQLRQQLHRLLLFSAGSERRVSAERKAYGVRLVFSSRSVRRK